ncbi:MAG TPA: hypothetical protein DCW90_23950 [Lachnospiraceae bacterium]|nr:hypothetical protein [Lachnospiraceae bacterium]
MKRIFAVLLVLCLSMSPFYNLDVKAAEEKTNEDNKEVQVLTVNLEEELYQSYDKFNHIEVIHTKNETFTQMDFDLVKEILDNGTDFLVAHAKLEQINALFGLGDTVEEEGKQTIACYISSENYDYNVMPIYVDVLYEEEAVVSDEKYEKDIESLYQFVTEYEKTRTSSTLKYCAVSAEEIYKIKKEKEGEHFVATLRQEDLASLQTSTLVGDSFTENSKMVYFYKEGSANGTGTDYTYSANATKSGWSKMGSLNLAIYGIKVRTNDTITFDNVYSVVVATGMNDKYVKKFTVNVGVSALSSNVIVDETVSTGSSSHSTGKLATSVSSTGAISNYKSYAYNPGTQNVSTDFSKKYEKTWTFTPRTAVENGAYRVRPGILLKKTDGKSAAVTGTVSVNSFQVSGGVRNYTIKDTVKCSIKFKNHVEV